MSELTTDSVLAAGDEQRHSMIENLRIPVSRLLAAIVIVLAIISVPVGFENLFHESLEMIGYLLLIIGGLGRIWCSIYISVKKDTILCTDGPYSMCRNPLYFFSFIGVLGVLLAMQSLILCLIGAALFLTYYYFVIQSEEQRLRIVFGQEFAEYCESTSRFFPTISKLQRTEYSNKTSLRNIERCIGDVFWFFSAIILIDILEAVHHQGYLILTTLPI